MITLTREGPVATVTLDRAPANAFDEAQLDRLEEIVDQLGTGGALRVVLVRSGGRMFSAGADIAMIAERFADQERMVAFTTRMQGVYARLEALPVVSVALITGAATGGGLELALACDLRIATSDARLGLPEVAIGLIPGAGGTQRLTTIAGRATALRLILGAELVDGDEAQRLGIVHWSLPAAELESFAERLTTQLVAAAAPAVAATKRCIAAAGTGADGFRMEIDATRALLGTAEARELVRAFLAERKSPTRPGESPRHTTGAMR